MIAPPLASSRTSLCQLLVFLNTLSHSSQKLSLFFFLIFFLCCVFSESLRLWILYFAWYILKFISLLTYFILLSVFFHFKALFMFFFKKWLLFPEFLSFFKSSLIKFSGSLVKSACFFTMAPWVLSAAPHSVTHNHLYLQLQDSSACPLLTYIGIHTHGITPSTLTYT